MFYLTDIDEKIEFFNTNMVSLFDKVTKKLSKKYLPWLTDNVKYIIKLRDWALQKFKCTQADADWETYGQLRNFTVFAIRREKNGIKQN